MSKAGTPKSTGSVLTASQHNAFLIQEERIITNAGGTLEETDSLQKGQAITSYVGISTFLKDDSVEVGFANAYVLNPQDNTDFDLPINSSATWNGLLLRFRPKNTNTGASTVDFGYGVINIVNESGNALTGGELVTTRDAFLRYDLATISFILLNSTLQGQVATNQTNIATNQTNIATNQTNIATLQGLVIPSTATTQGLTYLTTKVNLTYNNTTSLLYSVIDNESKDEITNGTIDLTTTGVDGLDTGSLSANTTYHIFEIKDLTNNLVKTVTSASLTSPTLPSGFTKKKHVFSFITNASAELRPMIIDVDGRATYITTGTTGVNDLLNGNFVSAYVSLTVPSGVKCDVMLNAYASAEKAWFILDGDSNFTATSILSSNFFVQNDTAKDQDFAMQIKARTNINREVRVTSWLTSAGIKELSLYTQSYKLII